jgi:large subunit ribosomal protein L27
MTDALPHTMTQPEAAISGDDLTRVSGIGPKTVAVLAAAGITTYAQLAAATEAGLREILESAGPRYRLLDPTTWPDQAGRLLAESAQ